MSATNSTVLVSPLQRALLEERIKQHREEVDRLRAEFGDPEQALNRFVLEHFSLEAFLPDEPGTGQSDVFGWEDIDESDGW